MCKLCVEYVCKHIYFACVCVCVKPVRGYKSVFWFACVTVNFENVHTYIGLLDRSS